MAQVGLPAEFLENRYNSGATPWSAGGVRAALIDQAGGSGGQPRIEISRMVPYHEGSPIGKA